MTDNRHECKCASSTECCGGCDAAKEDSEEAGIVDTKCAKISVYIDNGAIYSFVLQESDSTSENIDDVVQDIIEGGYVHNDGMGLFEWYPVNRIRKVRVTGVCVPTERPDIDEGV